jgi:hypothetical protein
MITIALIVAVVALLSSVWLSLQVLALRRRLAAVPRDGDVVGLMQEIDQDLSSAEKTLSNLVPRVSQLEAQMPEAVSYIGVINYDAFGDISGNQSRSVALLDRGANGLVLSILVGRNQTLFYTKQVRDGKGAEELSPEEHEAIRRAMAG